jgi:hypothetical protein
MKSLLLALGISLAPLCAAAAQPSPDSVEALLEVTHAEAMLQTIYSGIEQNMRLGMKQATAGRPVTDEQRHVLDAAPAKFVEVMRQELTWARLKPIYVDVYRDTFTQEEIEGLIAFYRSPAGRAYIEKTPLAMQKSAQAVQSLMGPLVEKMRAAMEQALVEARLAR